VRSLSFFVALPFFAAPQVFTPLILGLFVLALSACQPVTLTLTESGLQTSISEPTVPNQAETLSTQEQVATQPEALSEELPEETITELLEGEAVIKTADLATPPAIEPPVELPKITTIDPQEFLGKTSDYIASQLGEADFKRQEGKIGIWQYRQANCVVDFFFKNADNSANLSQKIAMALDVRKRIIGQPLDEKRCQKELYQRQL
jgi:hypothetical protein